MPGVEIRDKKRAFVSYSHHDGAKVAASLSERLKEMGFSLWRDLSEMEGGRDCDSSFTHARNNPRAEPTAIRS